MAAASDAPTELEEYRLVSVLGRGAMGVVWLAHDRNLDRAVAIKLIAALTAGADRATRDRFLVEARAAARIHHPNVVTIHRVGEFEGQPYLVTEYVRGTTLDKLPRPVEPALAFDLALGLARGLAVAHRHGVLHRDVKPANAILTVENEVKLLDFGLAKLRDHADVASDAGQVMGTPAYLAPEAWAGAAPGPAADVYALGATLFHLLTGRLPHEATSPAALAGRATSEDAPSLRSLRPECPSALAEVVDACLKRDPEARLASGEAVREALELRARAAKRPPLPAGNPYRGLAAFAAEHRHLFFGRDLEIADVLERLRAEPWVVVAGRSGAGKSSLVRAGVLPRIVDDGALAEGGPVAWRVLPLVPGARPRAALVAAAATLLRRDEAALARELDDDPGALARELRGDRATGTVVLVDQLEELATLAEPEELAAFVAALRHLLVPAPSLRVIATLRSDYIGHLEALGPVHRELTRALYVLGPMTVEGLRDAVVAPAAAHEVTFEDEADVDALVAAVERSQGSLPLVEFALAKLWELRDPARHVLGRAALAGIGGVNGALSRHADEVIAALSPAGAAEARRLLLRLVTAERTRARRSEEELRSSSAPPELVRETLEALVRGRLLTVGEGTYEVAHEAMIASWTRLRLWLDEEQGAHRTRERLEVAAADWERLGRRAEALWSGRRLDELAALDAAELSPRERAFADASRTADRRRRWSRRILLVAAPTVLFGTIFAVQTWNRSRAEARASAAATRAAALVEASRGRSELVDMLQRSAFAAYDAGETALGAELYRRARAETEGELEAQDAALAPLNEAFATVAGHVGASRVAADLYAARFLSSERDGDGKRQRADEQQLRFYDREGRHRELLGGAAPLTVTSDPPGATVALARVVDDDGDGRFEETPVGKAGPSPRREGRLPLGSYVATLSHPGYAPVRYPVVVERGAGASVLVPLLRPADIPEGFVYVPAGVSIVGTTNLSSPAATPRRKRAVGAFFMARTEVTFGEWVAYAASVPPASRRFAMLAGLLTETPDGEIAFDMRELAGPILRQGERVTYTAATRAREGTFDWMRWPVIYVATGELGGFLAWERARIPGARPCTDVEWERAARGADGRLYPHGNRLLPADASFGETYGVASAHLRFLDEVGQFPASRSVFGVDDLAGSVAEMVYATTGRGFLKPGSWRQLAGSQSADQTAPLPPGYRNIETGLRICSDLFGSTSAR